MLVDKALRNDAFHHDVVVTMTDIKEWLNPPNKHYAEKNELVVRLDKVFAESDYLYPIEPFKKRNSVKDEYIFEISIAGDPSWIIVHETDWGEF